MYDHAPGGGEAAVPKGGRAGPVPPLGSGEARVCFLACLVLLEPCLGFVYRDVFCLTKYEKWKKKKFPYKCPITSVCSAELFCNKVCKGKINFFFFGYKTATFLEVNNL